jgi:hypothetical protein
VALSCTEYDRSRLLGQNICTCRAAGQPDVPS